VFPDEANFLGFGAGGGGRLFTALGKTAACRMISNQCIQQAQEDNLHKNRSLLCSAPPSASPMQHFELARVKPS